MNYTYAFNSISTANSYLTLANLPASNGGFQTIEIKNITITETAPTTGPTFTLAPTSVNIQCGSTTAQTFTITNVNNTPNVTAYNWNLGSSSNGWLYNGNPASQNITTTTNAITLTPACGGVQQSIAATVTAGGTNYATNNSSVINTLPPLSINGSNIICTNPESYFVDNLPCNSTVTWLISPSGIVSSSISGNTITLTRIADGAITLTANVSASCGITVPALNKPINVLSTPTNPTAAVLLIKESRTGETYARYRIDPAVTGATYVVTPSVQTNTYYFVDQNIVEVIYPCTTSPGIFTATVSIQNNCGTSAGSVTIDESFAVCGGGGGRDRMMSVSPNPVISAASVSVEDKKSGKQFDIKWIQVLNKSGVLVKEYKYGKGTKQVTLDLSNLKQDIYTIRAFDGSLWTSAQVRVK